ncbi:metallophosphoesterase [Chitinophaga parva]|nr:metallophosphoesterase [Chitinophaga parva]
MQTPMNNNNSRRKFLGNVALAGLASLWPVEKAMARARGTHTTADDTYRFITPPYLQRMTPRSVSIMWITSRNCYSWVEYGTNGQLDQHTHHETAGLIDANDHVHRIDLVNLQPNTTYQYRVCSKEITDFHPYKLQYGATITSETYTFKTFDDKAQSVSWLMLNDIHDRPASFAPLLALNNNAPQDFVFLNGDMFDFQTDEQQIIDHLLTPLTQTFASQQPFFYTRGNHETRGKFARQHAGYFACPGDRYYFSFTQGPVHFVVLDTGEDKLDDHVEYSGLVAFDNYRIEQARWLEQEINTPAFRKAKYRVVLMHIPPFNSGDAHGTLHCRELFNPLFNKGKVDLMICGHTHKYGVWPPTDEHHYPIIIGGGPKEGNRTLIRVNANGHSLDLSMLRDDGVEVGTYNIQRS